MFIFFLLFQIKKYILSILNLIFLKWFSYFFPLVQKHLECTHTQTLVIVWNKEGRKQILNSKNKLLQQINVCCNGCFQSWIFMVELRRVCATLNYNHNKLKGCSVFCIMTLKRLKLKVSFYRRRNWHSFRMLNAFEHR